MWLEWLALTAGMVALARLMDRMADVLEARSRRRARFQAHKER